MKSNNGLGNKGYSLLFALGMLASVITIGIIIYGYIIFLS